MEVKPLIDLNVWLDIAVRPQLFPQSVHFFRQLMTRSRPGFALCSYTTFFYLASKTLGGAAALDFLSLLEKRGVDFVGFDYKDALLARSLKFKDHEDACIAASAARNGYSAIVTRNVKDFKHAPIPAFLPEKFNLDP